MHLDCPPLPYAWHDICVVMSGHATLTCQSQGQGLSSSDLGHNINCAWYQQMVDPELSRCQGNVSRTVGLVRKTSCTPRSQDQRGQDDGYVHYDFISLLTSGQSIRGIASTSFSTVEQLESNISNQILSVPPPCRNSLSAASGTHRAMNSASL